MLLISTNSNPDLTVGVHLHHWKSVGSSCLCFSSWTSAKKRWEWYFTRHIEIEQFDFTIKAPLRKTDRKNKGIKIISHGHKACPNEYCFGYGLYTSWMLRRGYFQALSFTCGVARELASHIYRNTHVSAVHDNQKIC